MSAFCIFSAIFYLSLCNSNWIHLVSKLYVSNFNVGLWGHLLLACLLQSRDPGPLKHWNLCIYFLHMINVFQFDIYTHESTSHVCTHESTSHVCTHESTSHVCIFPKLSCSGFFYTYFCIICVSLCLDMCDLKWNLFWHSQISVSF